MGTSASESSSSMGSGIGDFASDVSDVFSFGPGYAKGAEIDDYALRGDN